MSYQEFLAEIKTKGLAKNNRFAVSMHGTPITRFNNDQLRSALLFCDGTQLPGQSYATVPNRTFGELRETPYDRLYEPVTLSFYVDREMQVKYMFDRWMDQIASPGTRKFNYYDDYTATLAISVFDNYAENGAGFKINDVTRDWESSNNETYVVVLHEAYPKSVSAVQMDSANKDVMKISVTFQYKYWLSEPQEIWNQSFGDPISPSIQRIYTQAFGDFQQAFNDFGTATGVRIPNPTAITGGLPGFDGSLPDTQGFLSTAAQKLSTFAQTSLFTSAANNMPKLSDVMNLRF
jgi:hypothetical protein